MVRSGLKGCARQPTWRWVGSASLAVSGLPLDPTPQLHGVLLYAVMASAFRRAALERHSSESLDRISTICHSSWVPLPRLAELADQILTERQCLNPVRVIPGFSESELPY
jgi:hypothetical protein